MPLQSNEATALQKERRTRESGSRVRRVVANQESPAICQRRRTSLEPKAAAKAGTKPAGCRGTTGGRGSRRSSAATAAAAGTTAAGGRGPTAATHARDHARRVDVQIRVVVAVHHPVPLGRITVQNRAAGLRLRPTLLRHPAADIVPTSDVHIANRNAIFQTCVA